MLGAKSDSETLLFTVGLQDFVPARLPLRTIRAGVGDAPAKSDAKSSAMEEGDVERGRPSIAREGFMRAMQLQRSYSVRGERQRVWQIQHSLPFRWIVGLSFAQRRMSAQAATAVSTLLPMGGSSTAC